MRLIVHFLVKRRFHMSDQDNSAVYNIVGFVFDGKDAASENMKEIKSSGVLDGYKIKVQAVVEQDENGKVHIHEPGHGVWGTALGAGGGGLLGLIGGPAGLLAWTVGGAVLGGLAGKYAGRPIAKGDLQELGSAMTPNSSALLLVLEDKDTENVINDLQGYNAQVVTLTLGDDLSGEIDQLVVGEAGATDSSS
jgi:uncharacterized membrane protein